MGIGAMTLRFCMFSLASTGLLFTEIVHEAYNSTVVQTGR